MAMTPEQRAQRALQAKQALEFTAPAFDHLTDTYLARQREIACSTPWEYKKIIALSQAIRVTEVARAQLEAIISEGPEAQRDIDHARKIEQMSDPDRRLLNIGAWARN